MPSHQAIARIMADKVYTSAEFKRERDNFHVSSKMIMKNKSMETSKWILKQSQISKFYFKPSKKQNVCPHKNVVSARN